MSPSTEFSAASLPGGDNGGGSSDAAEATETGINDDVFGNSSEEVDLYHLHHMAESEREREREGEGEGEPHHHHRHHRNFLADQPSDVPRMRTQQTTAGYREGIAAAKASVAQPGFDEGFPLGAALGLRAGMLVGVLEGILASVRPSATAPTPSGAATHVTKSAASTAAAAAAAAEEEDEVRRLQGMCEQAQEELGLRGSLFACEFWEGDGNWKFDVEDGGFAGVASSHPLVRKWHGLVGEIKERWGVSRECNEDRNEDKSESTAVGQDILEW